MESPRERGDRRTERGAKKIDKEIVTKIYILERLVT